MSVADDEAVIVKYYKDAGWGKPEVFVASKGIPGMYRVENASTLIVRGGKIVDGGGLDAVRTYMRDVKLLERKPDVHEFAVLLVSFKALPPVTSEQAASPDQYFEHETTHTELNPRLEWSADGGKFVLHYLAARSHGSFSSGGGGGLPNPNLARLFRWTLTIAKDYKLAWQLAPETTYDTSRP